MLNPFLDPSWQTDHIREIKNRAGARYSPKLHVDLPIRRIFSGLTRDETFYSEIRTHYGKLRKAGSRFSHLNAYERLAPAWQALESGLQELQTLISQISTFTLDEIDWPTIHRLSGQAQSNARALLEAIWKEPVEESCGTTPNADKPTREKADGFNHEKHSLNELSTELRFFKNESAGHWAELSNNRSLLLTGSAGTGTHLLCDVVETRVGAGKPAVLVFGEFFKAGEPLLRQLAAQLRLAASITKENILKELNEAGKSADTRCIVAFDGINETQAREFWQRELPALQDEIAQRFPYVALVVSVRDGFESDVVPANNTFVHEIHPGLEFREWEAASKYFQEFGIPLPEIPVLMPEFRIPLFLLLFCKGISERQKNLAKKKQDKKAFQGHEGATFIFEHFVKAGADRIAKEFNLKPGRDHGQYVIWDTVVEQMAAAMSRRRLHHEHIAHQTLVSIIKQAHPTVDPKAMILSLERNFLITKLPHYLLTIAANPHHPFNAKMLHIHLMQQGMPKRDSWWSTFLHYQYGEHGAVDRLLTWAFFDPQKTLASDEAVDLVSTALVWFCTSSNRFVRDRATKALVSVLTDRLPLITGLLNRFKAVDDPYVLQRLYAVAYGCALRTKNIIGLAELVQRVYDLIFASGSPPPDILLRDYARGVIETAVHHGMTFPFDLRSIRPPYRSEWPDHVPTKEQLEAKFHSPEMIESGENFSLSSIWFSVMSFGDFARYIIGTNSGSFQWSNRKLGKRDTPTLRQQRELFLDKLTREQKRLWDALSVQSLKKVTHLDDKIVIGPADEKRRLKAEKAFLASLSPSQKRKYPAIMANYYSQNSRDDLAFDLPFVQRWIFNRVMELGWSPDLHGEFDLHVGRNDISRTEHKAERIGKKYQWIAYHELLARVSDNFKFRGNGWSDTPQKYEGPWQIWVRDIDPSYVPSNGPLDLVAPWKSDLPSSLSGETTDRKSWIRATDDIPSIESVISWKNGSHGEWLLLHGFWKLEDATPPEFESSEIPRRDLWFRVRSVIVPASKANRLSKWLQRRRFGNWLNRGELHRVFLYEYPWAPSIQSLRGAKEEPLNDPGEDEALADVLLSADEYMWESNGRDCSIDDTINLHLPARWLATALKLQQAGHARFVTNAGELLVCDPGGEGYTPSSLMINKAVLLKALKANDMSVVWYIVGEKQEIGGRQVAIDWNGRLDMWGTCTISSNGSLQGSFGFEFDAPH